jgi:hypothetical protein
MTFDRRDEEIRRALEELGPELDSFRVADAPDHLVERTLRRARGQLLAPERRAPEESAGSILPKGFKRELARLLALTTPVAAATVMCLAFVWERLPEWLGSLLPAGIAAALAGAWLIGAVTLLSLTYGSLPFFAHQRVVRASAHSAANEARS